MVKADMLICDLCPEVKDHRDDWPADTRPTEAENVITIQQVLNPWFLPTGNDFIQEPAKCFIRPEGSEGSPGCDFTFVQGDFNDDGWDEVIYESGELKMVAYWNGGKQV